MSTASRLSQRARLAAGQPISYLMREALARPELISLAAGFVDQETLPVEATLAAVEHVMSDPDDGRTALQYGTTMGDVELRDALVARLMADDGLESRPENVSVDQVIITAGSNELLYLIGETLLDPGDIVLCAAPSYFVFLGGVQNLAARAIGVAVDDEGIIPEALEEEIRRHHAAGELERIKAIYVTSFFDNPSSLNTSHRRRIEIVEIAKRWSAAGGIYVVDDAAYRELRYFVDDIPSLFSVDPQHDTVIHTGSFSKSFSPGIRVGWGILPKALVEPICNQKGNIDFGSPHFNQRIMTAVLKLGLFDPHIERIRDNYREKLRAMLDAADQFLGPIAGVHWSRATGGLYVWMQVEGVDTSSNGPLFQAALGEGVMYVPGVHCYPSQGESVQTDRIRLSFGVQPPDRIRTGIQALANAVKKVTDS